MSISKDVIKQCLISKQREVDEAVLCFAKRHSRALLIIFIITTFV